jgi:hypothetical protein
MPDSNTPGLVVSCGEKRYATILINEELGRFGIDRGTHNRQSPLWRRVAMIADWTAERLVDIPNIPRQQVLTRAHNPLKSQVYE